MQSSSKVHWGWFFFASLCFAQGSLQLCTLFPWDASPPLALACKPISRSRRDDILRITCNFAILIFFARNFHNFHIKQRSQRRKFQLQLANSIKYAWHRKMHEEKRFHIASQPHTKRMFSLKCQSPMPSPLSSSPRASSVAKCCALNHSWNRRHRQTEVKQLPGISNSREWVLAYVDCHLWQRPWSLCTAQHDYANFLAIYSDMWCQSKITTNLQLHSCNHKLIRRQSCCYKQTSGQLRMKQSIVVLRKKPTRKLANVKLTQQLPVCRSSLSSLTNASLLLLWNCSLLAQRRWQWKPWK